jgi:hypothetical protein
VRALGEVWCRAAIVYRPPPPRPAHVNAGLHPGAPDMVRTAVLLLAWVSRGARWLLGAVDRQNVTRTQDDLKVLRAAIFLCLRHAAKFTTAWGRCLPGAHVMLGSSRKAMHPFCVVLLVYLSPGLAMCTLPRTDVYRPCRAGYPALRCGPTVMLPRR